MKTDSNPFQVNDLALCIDVNWLPASKPFAYQVNNWPDLWEFYTVRRVKGSSIFLEEVVNPIIRDESGRLWGEPEFWHKHFIKVEVDKNIFEVYESSKEEVLSG